MRLHDLNPQQKALTFDDLRQSMNIALLLEQKTVDAIGTAVVEGFRSDEGTRAEWVSRMNKAIKLALQVQEHKAFPWQGASNVKFPIVTVAALQFLARVSILTKGRNLAKVSSIGKDPTGAKSAQASRIADHISLQLKELSPGWFEQDEQSKLAMAILGSSFKKTYYDPVDGEVISEHIPAMDIVLDYFTKDVNKANRITHRMFMSANDIQERVHRGIFCEVVENLSQSSTTGQKNELQIGADEAQGLRQATQNSIVMQEVLEQHLWLDLDGDGYEEPYIASVLLEGGKVLRIVARYTGVDDVHRVNDHLIRQAEDAAMGATDPKDRSKFEQMAQRLEDSTENKIIRIDPIEYFTRYLFIPSPDGGVYGLGFGALLGPLNDSVNTLINQLIDSGTMANTAGGFLGRGVKMKSGTTAFSPFEWKPVDTSGADLRQSVFPLPVREPSNVLFQLLGTLITYSEKVGSSTDQMTGISPGQNTPAETSRNTMEQGMMLFSGIFARVHRGFTQELRKFYHFNQLFFGHSPNFREFTNGENAILAPDDYTSRKFFLYPSVSAESYSQQVQRGKAVALHQLAGAEPGFNRYLVVKNLLQQMDVEDIDLYFPDPAGPNAIKPPVPPKLQELQLKLQQQDKEHQSDLQLKAAELQSQIRLTEAKITELEARAAQEMANANGAEVGHQIALMDTQLGAAKAHRADLLQAAALLHKIHSDRMNFAQQSARQAAPQEQSTVGGQQPGAIENGNATGQG